MKNRVILHSDVNNFFASVECAINPALNGKAVAVAGDPQKRTGIILAKNELAKSMGIKTGDTLWQAKQKCPDIIFVEPHMQLYEKISKKLHNLYLSYTDIVEPLGLDECWLDITPSLNYLGKDGKEVADEIRKRVKDELNLTVSVGVSFTKVYAKLGSDLKKPNATTIIDYQHFKQIAYPLPLNSIVGIGRRLNAKFAERGIETIGDFCNLPPEYLALKTNKSVIELQKQLRGEIFSYPKCYYNLDPPKSFGNGTTTIIDIQKEEDVAHVISFLCEKISSRLAKSGYFCSCIHIDIKDSATLKFVGHSKKIEPTFSAKNLKTEGLKLLDTFYAYNYPLRAVRVSVSNLSLFKNHQISMFTEKQTKLTESVQQIREKFGEKSIFLGSDSTSFINTNRFTDSEASSEMPLCFLDYENLDE